MKNKFTVEKVNDLWKVNYDDVELLFQSLEDLSIYMENHFDSLEETLKFEEEQKELYNEYSFQYYNKDESIN